MSFQTAGRSPHYYSENVFCRNSRGQFESDSNPIRGPMDIFDSNRLAGMLVSKFDLLFKPMSGNFSTFDKLSK